MEKINSIKDLNEAIKNSVGYMLGVTLFDGKNLTNFLLTKDFPKTDLLQSLGSIKELVISELENPTKITTVINNDTNS